MTVVSMPKYPCSFCKKNEATQLCDFVIRYMWTSMKDEFGRLTGRKYVTCDNQICKECAVNVATFEFCPSCYKLHLEIQERHDRRPGRLLIDSVMGNN